MSWIQNIENFLARHEQRKEEHQIEDIQKRPIRWALGELLALPTIALGLRFMGIGMENATYILALSFLFIVLIPAGQVAKRMEWAGWKKNVYALAIIASLIAAVAILAAGVK